VKSLLPIILFALSAYFISGCARPEAQAAAVTTQSHASGWARHCTLEGLQFQEEGEREFLAQFADRCGPADACILACLRSGCAYGIGGGCFHACGAFGTSDLEKSAEEFAAGSSVFCRWRRPNNSFKPKPLRGSA
jgi:hypothetical protein